VDELERGERLGSYLIEERLGDGAVGIVYRATREPDGETVALKLLRRELADDPVFRRRFDHEARAAGEVRNSHLVPILDVGQIEGRPFLAVAFVKGRTLERRLEDDGPLPIRELVVLLSHLGSGLDALHRADIVHRDLKPSNVMLDPNGSAAITDFGLAKGRAYTVLTEPGRVLGTLDYLAPELLRGGEATPASDRYALGCVAFECVAGRAPFADLGLLELPAAHLNLDPPDAFAGRGDGNPSLSWAILQALAKDPDQRPPTATAYANLVRFAAAES
jgi:serine/threonine protein kinase